MDNCSLQHCIQVSEKQASAEMQKNLAINFNNSRIRCAVGLLIMILHLIFFQLVCFINIQSDVLIGIPHLIFTWKSHYYISVLTIFMPIIIQIDILCIKGRQTMSYLVFSPTPKKTTPPLKCFNFILDFYLDFFLFINCPEPLRQCINLIKNK